MKNFNLTKTALIVIAMAFSFVSCDKDDDVISAETTTSINNETLKGTWYSNAVKNKENQNIRWVINIDNNRMDKYIQYKNGDVWKDLEVTFFTCYSSQYSNRVITGKVISRLGALSEFLSLGRLSLEERAILKQRKQEHDVIKIIDFVGKKLKMELLEKEEAQTLTFEKGKQVKMLEIKTSWK